MVIYFSYKGHTEAYARELASLCKDKAFKLTEKKKRSGFMGFISGGFQSITKKETPVNEMPDLSKENVIYLCSPIWASRITPAIRYFINHASLKGIKVNFLLTCAAIDKHEDYRNEALSALNETEAEPGAAYVFACSAKDAVDTEIIRNHIKKVILGE